MMGGVQRASMDTGQRLAICAIAGPVLFTLAWFVLGFLNPGYTLFGTHIDTYSAISQPISGLGLGPTGPFMNATFVLTGLLLTAGVVGIFQGIEEMSSSARLTSIVLMMLVPLGAILVGIFTLESGFVHFLASLIALAAPVISFLVVGLLLRRVPRWRSFGSWLLLGSPLTLALVVLFFLTFTPTVEGTKTGVAGLTERLLTTEVLAWYALMGWWAIRHSLLTGRTR
jgi:hypothetical membrane protein